MAVFYLQPLLLLLSVVAGIIIETPVSVDTGDRRAKDRVCVPVVEILHVFDVAHIGHLR